MESKQLVFSLNNVVLLFMWLSIFYFQSGNLGMNGRNAVFSVEQAIELDQEDVWLENA